MISSLTLPTTAHHLEINITFPVKIGFILFRNDHNHGISTLVGLKTYVADDAHVYWEVEDTYVCIARI